MKIDTGEVDGCSRKERKKRNGKEEAEEPKKKMMWHVGNTISFASLASRL